MKTMILSTLILAFCQSVRVIAQSAPETLWTKTFGGFESEQAISVIENIDSGYTIVGATNSYGNGQMDAWIIKVDINGNLLWDHTYGGNLNDMIYSVLQTAEGEYLLAGSTESYGNGGYDLWLIKIDQDGNEIWNKTFGGTGDDLAEFIEQKSEGGFILTGSTTSFGNGAEDVWLINVDLNGIELWNRTYGGALGERAYTVHQTEDSGFIMAGRTESLGNRSLDAWLIKVDENGNEVWDKTFGGTEADNAYSLQVTVDGGYILGGYTKSSGNGEEDIWLIKTNINGEELWNKKLGGSGVDVTYSVQQAADFGYFISGFTNSVGNGEMDVWLIRTDRNGDVLWDKTYGGYLNDIVFSGQQISDGGYIATGFTESFGNGQQDFYLIKLNADEPNVIEHSTYFNPNNFRLMQNYPNPFNPATTISFQIPELSFVTLKVYDVLGNEIETLVDEEKSAGNYTIDFDASELVSGIYFYQLKSDSFTDTKKMLLIK